MKLPIGMEVYLVYHIATEVMLNAECCFTLFSYRHTGALCAMKEVNIIPDDAKSAESLKQLEQVIYSSLVQSIFSSLINNLPIYEICSILC
jgi:hypothetical protein